MENETKVIEVVGQESSKKGVIGKIAMVATGVAAGIGAVIFYKKRKNAKQVEEAEVVEDIPNEDTNVEE